MVVDEGEELAEPSRARFAGLLMCPRPVTEYGIGSVGTVGTRGAETVLGAIAAWKRNDTHIIGQNFSQLTHVS